MLEDLFESDELVAMSMRYIQSYGIPPNWAGLGMLGFLFLAVTFAPRTAGLIGGTHQWAHAATKIIAANRGQVHSKKIVDKVLIENGQATGVRLSDGTEVKARKLVVSTLSPKQLCFELIGEEYFDSEILSRVQNLESRFTCITWYTWALHELPKWNAANVNPDINKTATWTLISKDPSALEREEAMIRMGKMPDELQLTMVAHSMGDPTRAPEGKYSVLTEQFVLPGNALTEQQWIEFKKSHAEEVMKLWQKHAPNMTWDNIIGYIPLTPYDHCKLANMAPSGNWGIIDNIPSQLGRNRPIPELAGHRTPIKNLYATGSAWHPMSGGTCFQGYNCYKIIAEDFGLKKPWEEQGHPW
jgi:phytoene dehydrogenase-like protein